MSTLFVATSRRFYPEAEVLCDALRARGWRVFHPYFDRDQALIEGDPALKARVTLEHFPEIDRCDLVYGLLRGGYTGVSVAMELAYAFARGKRIVTSEPSAEYAVRALVADVMTPEEFLNAGELPEGPSRPTDHRDAS